MWSRVYDLLPRGHAEAGLAQLNPPSELDLALVDAVLVHEDDGNGALGKEQRHEIRDRLEEEAVALETLQGEALRT